MSIWEHMKAAIATYGPKLILAIVVLWVGLWLIKKLVKFIDRRAERREMDPSLRPFLRTVVSMLLKVMLIISVASMVGVAMTSFVAVLAAAGLAVGLALQGSLANFAGGVLILGFKPFKVGDVIEAQGFLGKVHEIQIFNTVLKAPDNRTVIIPNGGLSNGSMVNYSTEENRRVDLTFSVGYGDDLDKARQAIEKVVAGDERIHKDPAPFVRVGELADSSVNFTVRLWCKGSDYWDIFFDMHERTKKEFDKQKISIPYPQMDVHMDKA